MPSKIFRLPVLASIFGAASVTLVFAGEILRRRVDFLWLGRPLVSSEGSSEELVGFAEIGPPEFLEVYDDRFIMVVLIAALLLGSMACFLGILAWRKKDQSHFTAIGIVLGLISFVWVGKFILYGV